MIDTIYIYHQLPKDDYNIIFKRIQFLSQQKKINLYRGNSSYQTSNRYHTNYLFEQGFLEIALSNSLQPNGYKRRAIEIKLKPKMLLDPQNYSDVTYFYELKFIRKAFNKIIKDISPTLPDFYAWNCRRVDYAITINTKFVAQYIQLLKKGNVSKYFLEKSDEFYDAEGSLYLKSKSDDIRINFYDKHSQVINNSNCLGKLDNYKQARNNLRLEVQCSNQKIRSIKEKYGLSSTTVKDLLQPNISQNIITEYYTMIAGRQDYYSFDKAAKTIGEKQVLLEYTPHEYIDVLLYIEKITSIWKAKLSYPAKENVFDKRTREIKRLGINPVLIPIEWQLTTVPNLYNKIINIFRTTELGLGMITL